MKHVLLILGGCLSASTLLAQTGAVADFQKVSQTSGNFNAELLNQGKFGFVSGQASSRVYSGAPFAGNGEVHIIDLATDGSVAAQSRIQADDFEIFEGVSTAEFGTATLPLGDLNNDGIDDYLVGAPGMGSHGALVLLQSEGALYNAELISIPEAHQTSGARWGDHLYRSGNSIFAGLQSGAGSVLEFELDADLNFTLLNTYSVNTPELSSLLDDGDRFGTGICVVDIDGDGVEDIICGAPGDDAGGSNYGAVYQLYRNAAGDIDHIVKLASGSGNFNGFLNSDDDFGISIVPLGDLDGDGLMDIAVGAPGDDDGNIDVGAVWIIFLKADGTMKRHRKINLMNGNFAFSGLAQSDRFATRIASLGDINGDGTIDLAVGTPQKDDGGNNRGAFYSIMVEYCEVPTAIFDYVDNGGTVSFSIPGGDGYSYIWNFSDGGFSEQQNPTHTFTSSGTYTVCLTINGTCEGNSYCGPVQVNVQSLSSSESEIEGLEVFPNPAHTFVKVQAPETIVSATLIDLTGSLVWQQGNVAQKDLRIELGHLPKGLYILNINTSKGQAARKVQVM